MPSVSKKQRNMMAAAAHNPQFAKKVGVPQSVAKDFNAADKGHFGKQLPTRKGKKKAPSKTLKRNSEHWS